MASKAAAANTAEAPEAREEAAEAPLLDSMVAAVKKMVARGKERGYVTYDDINAALPPEQVTSEQLEDTLTMLSELGINVVENEEGEEAAATEANAEEEAEARGNVDDDDIGRTDDPVRMYLREMGSVELLSREGEIAIAKRIEAGREMMIGGLCESPLTIRALLIWRDALVEGRMLLRDIVDLDATYGNNGFDPTVEEAAEEREEAVEPEGAAEGEAAPGAPGQAVNGEDPDADAEEASISLAAMEAELKPAVLEKFEDISALYRRLQKQQEARLVSLKEGEELQKPSEKKYDKLRAEMHCR